MSTLRESVDNFHATITVVELAMRMSATYDFVADPHQIVAKLEASWTALKMAARDGMREDVGVMLAEFANRYRECARMIAQARDPKVAAKRRRMAASAKRDLEIEKFVIAEAQPYWRRQSEKSR